MNDALPATEWDAGTEAVYSVYAPHFWTDKLISRDISYASARKVAEAHGALVFLTSDLPA